MKLATESTYKLAIFVKNLLLTSLFNLLLHLLAHFLSNCQDLFIFKELIYEGFLGIPYFDELHNKGKNKVLKYCICYQVIMTTAHTVSINQCYWKWY